MVEGYIQDKEEQGTHMPAAVKTEEVLASDGLVSNLSSAFEENLEDEDKGKETDETPPTEPIISAENNIYVAEKPNTVENDQLGNDLPNLNSFDISPVNEALLSLNQTTMLNQLGSSLYFTQISAMGIEDFGLYYFDSFIKGFGSGTSFSFETNSYSKFEKQNILSFATPVVSGGGVVVISGSTIFGANGNDNLSGGVGNDIIYGNVVLASAPYNPIYTINNPTPAVGDRFGEFLDQDGNYIIIGASEDDTGAVNAGSAYIYDITTGALVWTLNNPEVQDNYFANAVAISGNYALVADKDSDDIALNAGKVYVYNVSTGGVLYTLTDPTGGSTEWFGHDVAMDGNYAIIGSPRDSAGAPAAGTAYIYDVTTGALVHTLNNPTPVLFDMFGEFVDISGNYAAVSASSDDTAGADSGSIYVFDVTTGALLHTITNPNPSSSDWFGRVAIDGDFLVVGTPWEDPFSFNEGIVYLYDLTTGSLLMTLDNPALSFGDEFGSSVDISGNYIAASARLDDTGISNSGSVYIFDRDTGDLLFSILNPTPESSEIFGADLVINGNNLIIGGSQVDPGGFPGAGAVYTYQIDFTDTDALYGGAGDDTLYGLYGDDVLYGQAGADSLFGGEGADRFVFEVTTAFDAVDRIEDFDRTESDIIDISDLLTGYTRGISDIDDFVTFTDVGGDTMMAIDANGTVGGANFNDVALIIGGAGLTPTNLENLGVLDGVA